MTDFIDFDRLEQERDLLRDSYRRARPFEHVVIDGFLHEAALATIRREGFHSIALGDQKSSDFIFARNKIESPRIEDVGAATRQLREELLSPRFQKLLNHITTLELFVDPEFTGGGVHQGGEGSYLDMHADFTRHPSRAEWIRELNILLYLNPDYEPSWGGSLDLQHRHTGEKTSVLPLENRAVIMLTKPHTLHGYKAIRFPEGRLRASIAAYAYSLDDGTRDVAYASTDWQPERRFRRTLAAVLNPLVVVKQKLLGSRTAERARR